MSVLNGLSSLKLSMISRSAIFSETKFYFKLDYKYIHNITVKASVNRFSKDIERIRYIYQDI